MFKSSRPIERISGWMAALAVLLTTLMPFEQLALWAGEGDLPFAICGAHQPDSGDDGSTPTRSAPAPFCPICLALHASKVLPPPVGPVIVQSTRVAMVIPPLPRQRLPSGADQPRPRARGPPDVL